MQTHRSAHDLLAEVLRRDPGFGTKAYLEGYAQRPKLTAEQFLAKIHTPNAPGPGGAQRHASGPWKVG